MTSGRTHYVGYQQVTAVRNTGENAAEILEVLGSGWQADGKESFFIDLSDRYYHEERIHLKVGSWLVKYPNERREVTENEPPYVIKWEFGYQDVDSTLVWRHYRPKTFEVKRPHVRVGEAPEDVWLGPWKPR